jgi:SAM-dependent methyltransferase
MVSWLRSFVETGASWFLGTFRRRLRSGSLPSPLYVNLGSAYRAPTGWLNLDRTINVLIARIPGVPIALYRLGLLGPEQYDRFRQRLWDRARYWDARYPIPVSDGAVSAIYSSHLLEHLDRGVAQNLFSDCYRALKSGGVLRIVVPDMYLISKSYVSIVDRLADKQLEPTDRVDFLAATIPASDVSSAAAAEYYDPDPRRQRLFGHRWMYDRWSIRAALERAGFRQIQECSYRQGATPDLDQLDCRPANSLHIEAIKA